MHTPPSAADGHSRRPAQPSGPRLPRPGPDRAQEEPGTAGLCTRLELWALEAEGLFPAAQPALLRELLLPWDGAALQAVPVGVGLSSSCSHCGSALPGQLLGTEPAQPQGAQCPSLPSALWHHSKLRALTTQPHLPHWGSPSTQLCLPQLLIWLQLGTPGQRWRVSYSFQTGGAAWEHGVSWES